MGATTYDIRVGWQPIGEVSEPFYILTVPFGIGETATRLRNSFPGSRFPGARESWSFYIPEFPGMTMRHSRRKRERCG